jgi:hypothetical protein
LIWALLCAEVCKFSAIDFPQGATVERIYH